MAQDYFLINFQVKEEDFLSFSRDTLFEKNKKNVKGKRILGCIEAAAGFGLLLWGLFKPETDPRLMILGFLLLLIATVTLVIVPYWYPKAMEKSMRSSYEKSGYRDLPLRAEISKTKVSETDPNNTTSCYWKDVQEVIETDGQFFIRVDKNRGMLLPKRDIPKDQIKDLRKLFAAAAEAFEFSNHRVSGSSK